MGILDKLRRNKKPTAHDYGQLMMALASQGHIMKAKELLAAVESESMIRLFLVEQYRDKDGDNAIVMAAWKGHAEMVELLVKAGASIDSTRKSNNSSLLYLASEHGHAGVVKVCLARGADLHLATTGGTTPLWVATRNGREDIMEMLLQAGADVDRPCCDKYTPLIVAVAKFKLSAVRLLLDWGAKLDLVDKDGDTAETTASKMGHSEALELLVEAKQKRAALLAAV